MHNGKLNRKSRPAFVSGIATWRLPSVIPYRDLRMEHGGPIPLWVWGPAENFPV
jgi:hypothetical protein